MKGRFAIYFGDKQEEEVSLDEWDSISVPSGIHCGWRNVGLPDGVPMAIPGAGKTKLPRYRDEFGRLQNVVKR